MKNFKIKRFLLIVFIIALLTVFTLICAFARGENWPNSSFLLNFLADCFYIFRFPTHVLFWKYMYDNPSLYIGGLAMNVILYAVLVEFLISYLKSRSNKKGAPEAAP
jgi:hypothetical protein